MKLPDHPHAIYYQTPEGCGWSCENQTTLYGTAEKAVAAWHSARLIATGKRLLEKVAHDPKPVGRCYGCQCAVIPGVVLCYDCMNADGNTDDAPARQVAAAVIICAKCWEGDARILGNVRAKDIVRALTELLGSPSP